MKLTVFFGFFKTNIFKKRLEQGHSFHCLVSGYCSSKSKLFFHICLIMCHTILNVGDGLQVWKVKTGKRCCCNTRRISLALFP